MHNRLKHIFDNSSCLTRRQMRQYVSGAMSAEERHASEVHMNSCAFCSEALDGMLAHRKEAVGLMADMSPAFIKEHFELTKPQVHVNSLAVSHNVSAAQAKSHASKVQFNWRMVFLIGGVLSAFAVMWYIEFIKDIARKKHLSQPTVVSAPVVAPAKVKHTNAEHHAVTAPAVAPATTTKETIQEKQVATSTSTHLSTTAKPTVEHTLVNKTKATVTAPIHKTAVVPAKKEPVIVKKTIVPVPASKTVVSKPVVKNATPVNKPATPTTSVPATTPASNTTAPVIQEKENAAAAIIGPPVDPVYKAK